MDLASMRDFATRYTVAWSSQDPVRVASFFEEHGSLKMNQDLTSVGRSAIAAAAQEFMTSFPDMIVKMEGLLRAGDGFIYRWTLIGTITGPGGTGNRVHFGGYEEWTIGENRLIARSLGHFDEAGYGRQLRSGSGNAPK